MNDNQAISVVVVSAAVSIVSICLYHYGMWRLKIKNGYVWVEGKCESDRWVKR